MTKSTRTLHRVVMMALAVIVTLTTNLNHALAEIPKSVDDLKKGYDGLKKGVDTIKSGLDFSSHVKQFIKGAGPADLIGGTSKQQYYMWLMLTLAFSLIMFRIRRNKAVTSSAFWSAFLGSYGVSVLLAFAFELVHSYQPWEKKSAGLLGVAGVLLAGGLVLHLGSLLTFFQAIQKRELYYFRQTWNLPHWVVPGAKPPPTAKPKKAKAPAEAEEAQLPEAKEAQPEADAPQKAPEPRPTALPVAASPKPAIVELMTCPHCKHKTRARATCCTTCGKKVHATITCPSCHNQTTAKGGFCVHCGAPLPGKLDLPPAPRKRPSSEVVYDVLDDKG